MGKTTPRQSIKTSNFLLINKIKFYIHSTLKCHGKKKIKSSLNAKVMIFLNYL